MTQAPARSEQDFLNEIERLKRRAEREKKARKEAEQVLEERSLALYQANQQLKHLTMDLENQVEVRTRELAESLARAEAGTRAKSSFLAMMSHEIRTPLNGILGLSELLSLSELSPEQQGYLRLIRQSGDTLLVVINDILDFSKIEAERLELDPQTVDLYRAIEDLGNTFRLNAEQKNLGFALNIARDFPHCARLDLVRLRQILGNLLSNALKFTEKGKITLSAASTVQENGCYRLDFSIRDEGIGISEDTLPRLFQAFTQADASTTRRFGGTGLGLAICARLSEAMGGGISVDSKIGQGSTFHVHIQAEAAEMPTTIAQESGHDCPMTRPDKQALRILLAEDNRVNQVLALRILEKLGFSADLAENGREAVSAASILAYDLILMDMQMPELDGLSATTQIRRLPLNKRPRIVALTANALDTDRQACLNAGMDDFLAKPFTVSGLKRQICLTCAQTDLHPQCRQGQGC